MKATFITQDCEPRRKTYAQVALVFMPAFFIWALLTLFALPALGDLWQAANFSHPLAAAAMQASKCVQHNFLLLAAFGLVALAVVESHSDFWQNHRKGILWSATLCFNVFVLVLAAGMLWTAILSAGLLLHWRW
jgi:hypothetical protein